MLKDCRVLYISYNGMLDPLGQSQVIPYLRELSRHGAQFTLLSFERAWALERDATQAREALRSRLAADGIDWHWLRYHQKPSLPATAYDVAQGLCVAQRLVRRKKIRMVHARSHIPATIALALKKWFGVKMIFDLRGLMADEYVDADHWRPDSVPYRLTKRVEHRAFVAADGIVTLTNNIWPIIKSWNGLRGREVIHEVVPCCADLERFRFSQEDRSRRREELGLQDRFVVVYSGSIGGWYLMEKMAEFFAAFRKRRKDSHFLWLTLGSAEEIDELMRTHGIAGSNYTVRAVTPADVASYLSAADAGIAFYKPGMSRLATSPVKVAEYLACGLPLVINTGIGDSDALITREKVGALVTDFNETEYAKAATTIEGLREDQVETRARIREVAERLFDVRTVGVERYARLYQAVLNG